MKNYEIRRADLQGRLASFHFREEQTALSIYRSSFKHAPDTDWRHGSKLVIHEWETDAEEDKARLDWLEEHGNPENERHFTRKDLDELRSAPQPTVTVIETAEGGK